MFCHYDIVINVRTYFVCHTVYCVVLLVYSIIYLNCNSTLSKNTLLCFNVSYIFCLLIVGPPYTGLLREDIVV